MATVAPLGKNEAAANRMLSHQDGLDLKAILRLVVDTPGLEPTIWFASFVFI